MRSPESQLTALDRTEIADFLFLEAELLDEDRFEEWLELFADDGIMWIPLDPNADPLREPSILYDDTFRRKARVLQLRLGTHWGQVPASRTMHAIANIRVDERPTDDGSITVRFNLTITEMRSGGSHDVQHGLGDQRTLAARCLYRLLRRPGGWSIKLKKVMLIDHDQPIENLTFII